MHSFMLSSEMVLRAVWIECNRYDNMWRRYEIEDVWVGGEVSRAPPGAVGWEQTSGTESRADVTPPRVPRTGYELQITSFRKVLILVKSDTIFQLGDVSMNLCCIFDFCLRLFFKCPRLLFLLKELASSSSYLRPSQPNLLTQLQRRAHRIDIRS